MKLARHRDFDTFLDHLSPEERTICLIMRHLILENFPGLKETWAYGAPYYKNRKRICFLYPASLPYSGVQQGVHFGLNQGYRLSNEHGLLQLGHRKEVAYIPILTQQDIQEGLFLEILHEALLLDEMP